MEDAIEAVRRFSRFYTRRIGALNARFLGAELTLPERSAWTAATSAACSPASRRAAGSCAPPARTTRAAARSR
jgi:hypothetical protein